MVRQALAFLSQLNAARQSPAAAGIPIASEACFSVAEHLATVDRRVARLQNIEPISAVDQEAIAFVNQELRPAWQQIRTSIESQAARAITTDLPRSNWCLSPSDFGFHNAMLAPDGQLRFFDFEYAGWDDPAKLACDFFCQPQLPEPMAEWDLFISTLAHSLKSGDNFPERARFLLDAYRVKWCCIMLNNLLPPAAPDVNSPVWRTGPRTNSPRHGPPFKWFPNPVIAAPAGSCFHTSRIASWHTLTSFRRFTRRPAATTSRG